MVMGRLKLRGVVILSLLDYSRKLNELAFLSSKYAREWNLVFTVDVKIVMQTWNVLNGYYFFLFHINTSTM